METTRQSTDKLTLVQQMYQQFGEGDIEGIMNGLSNDIDWEVYGPEVVPFAGQFSGKEGVGRFFQKLGTSTEFSHFEPVEFIVGQNQVVVLGREEAKAIPTGKTFKAEWAHVFHFKGDKVNRFREYTNTRAIAEAFE